MIRVWSWREAIQLSELAPTTRLVLLNLSIYMNDKGTGCYPSVETQARDTGLSKRAVVTHLQLACAAGFLKKEVHGFSGQGWKLNQYFATYPESALLKGGEPDAPRLEGEGGAPHSKGGANDSKKVVQEVHTNSPYNTPKNTPVKKHTKKSDKLTLGVWEENTGSELRLEMVQSWVGENNLDPRMVKTAIAEFREVMQANGNAYSDFTAAFKNYVRRGYLSKTLEQMRLTASDKSGLVKTRDFGLSI